MNYSVNIGTDCCSRVCSVLDVNTDETYLERADCSSQQFDFAEFDPLLQDQDTNDSHNLGIDCNSNLPLCRRNLLDSLDSEEDQTPILAPYILPCVTDNYMTEDSVTRCLLTEPFICNAKNLEPVKITPALCTPLPTSKTESSVKSNIGTNCSSRLDVCNDQYSWLKFTTASSLDKISIDDIESVLLQKDKHGIDCNSNLSEQVC